jgi:hypothetical protein
LGVEVKRIVAEAAIDIVVSWTSVDRITSATHVGYVIAALVIVVIISGRGRKRIVAEAEIEFVADGARWLYQDVYNIVTEIGSYGRVTRRREQQV